MEVPEMKESMDPDCHLTSAAAFVDGGIQEACDDACSICLEEFCESEPSTVTSCKHEFHLQCILEWCQRSSQCPMCWQSISLKDPSSQELLEAVEQERNFRATASRNRTIFHHPTLGDFELQHLPLGTSDIDLEERIMQHLAAASAMRRAGRRENHRSRSSAHGRPRFLVFSTDPNTPDSEVGEGSEPGGGRPSTPRISTGDERSQQILQLPSVQVSPSSGSTIMRPNQRRTLNSHNDLQTNYSQSPSRNQDRAGPSELQTFSDSLKSRFNAVSMRYKESISKSTRGWKERLFSRNNSVSELSSESRREVDAGIASIITNEPSLSTHLGDSRSTAQINQNNDETHCPPNQGSASASGLNC